MKYFKTILTLVLAICLTQCWLFKETEGFQEAKKFLESNSAVTEKIGKITKYGTPMGSYKLEGGFGTAKFDLTLTGEKGKADVKIALEKISFNWNVTSAFLKTDADEEINLLKMGNAFGFFNSFYSDEKWGAPKKPAQFKPETTLFFHGQSRGMKVDANNMVYAQLDVELTHPDGQKEIQTEVLKGPSESADGILDIFYSLPVSSYLPPDPKPYSLKLILWDLQSKEKIEVSGEFMVAN